MNEFQSIESGHAELKDSYSDALGRKLRSKREKLYDAKGLGENEGDQEKFDKGLLKSPREGGF